MKIANVAVLMLSGGLLFAQTEEKKTEPEAVRYQPVVDPERTHQADFVGERELSNLPVNRRNYLYLAVLLAGVSEVNDNVGVTDVPLAQAPQSGLSFGGNNGRGNVFWLDGGENYISTGGVRPSISQEAVLEFQVTRSNYSAEFGGGIGGIVNIVSKSGSNQLHGNLFGFLRHGSVQARNYFYPEKGAFTRTQAGGTLGGAIRKDRTYYFLSMERLQRRETGYVGLGAGVGRTSGLRTSQQELASYFKATRIPQLVQLGNVTEQILDTRSYPATLALFDANRGSFPFSEASTVGSARIDHRFSENNVSFLRFNASSSDSDNAQLEGLTGFSRGIVSDFSDQTLMLNHNFIISAQLVSESRFQINRTRFNTANRDRIGPTLDINGYGLFGKDWTLPTNLGEWHGQLQQNMFYMSGRHSLRFGVDINPVRVGARVQPAAGGQFSFGEYLPLGALYSVLSGDPSSVALLGTLLAQSGQPALAGYLNIPITALQAFNLGIPAFYSQSFGEPTWNGWFHRQNFFVNDVMRVNSRLTVNAGLRYEREKQELLGADGNNFGPRIGFAYTLTADNKTVLRGGYGLFYLRHVSQLAAAIGIQGGSSHFQLAVPLTGLPGSRNPANGLPYTSADIYQRLAAQGVIGQRAITAADLLQFGIIPGPNFPYQITFKKNPDLINGYAQQASLQVERALGRFAVAAGYNFNRGTHLPRIRNLNTAYGPPGPLGEPVIVPKDPLVSQLLSLESGASSFYHAFTLQATRRFSNRFNMNAHYSIAKSIDEVTDLNFVLPHDSLNTRKERGLSTFDQRHRFVGSAVLDMPGKFILSPIVTAASGRPFNVVTGEDGASRRPWGAGRNIGHGPSFFTADVRLSRKFELRGKSEGPSIELIGEGFNILNRTNFRRLNNVVGQLTVDDLPRPLLGRRGSVDDPLSFVSAFDARQFQFALRFRW